MFACRHSEYGNACTVCRLFHAVHLYSCQQNRIVGRILNDNRQQERLVGAEAESEFLVVNGEVAVTQIEFVAYECIRERTPFREFERECDLILKECIHIQTGNTGMLYCVGFLRSLSLVSGICDMEFHADGDFCFYLKQNTFYGFDLRSQVEANEDRDFRLEVALNLTGRDQWRQSLIGIVYKAQ